jgi:hypothetical protein
LLPLFTTNNFFPSLLTIIPNGLVPTFIVLTLNVAVSTTLISVLLVSW